MTQITEDEFDTKYPLITNHFNLNRFARVFT